MQGLSIALLLGLAPRHCCSPISTTSLGHPQPDTLLSYQLLLSTHGLHLTTVKVQSQCFSLSSVFFCGPLLRMVLATPSPHWFWHH